MSTDGKIGNKSFRIGTIQELSIIIFGALIAYQIFTFKEITKNSDVLLTKIDNIKTEINENNTFMKNEISNIKTDVNVLKNKVVELESQQRFNNKRVANEIKTDENPEGDKYYIQHAVFSGEKLVDNKKEDKNIKKY